MSVCVCVCERERERGGEEREGGRGRLYYIRQYREQVLMADQFECIFSVIPIINIRKAMCKQNLYNVKKRNKTCKSCPHGI